MPRRDALRRAVDQAIAETVVRFLRDHDPTVNPEPIAMQFQYEALLGAFIIEQNPYATFEQMTLPNIPEEHDAETRWIRKSGVLRDNSGFVPLSEFEPIPAGQPFQFVFEGWEHLEDTGVPEQPPGTAPAIPTDEIRQYPHNVVKIVRLRYALQNRMMPDGTPQRGFILMMYSGGDSSG